MLAGIWPWVGQILARSTNVGGHRAAERVFTDVAGALRSVRCSLRCPRWPARCLTGCAMPERSPSLGVAVSGEALCRMSIEGTHGKPEPRPSGRSPEDGRALGSELGEKFGRGCLSRKPEVPSRSAASAPDPEHPPPPSRSKAEMERRDPGPHRDGSPSATLPTDTQHTSRPRDGTSPTSADALPRRRADGACPRTSARVLLAGLMDRGQSVGGLGRGPRSRSGAALPVNPWAHWPLGPRAPWLPGPWAHKQTGPGMWTCGPVRTWACGPVGLWAPAPVDPWACGPPALLHPRHH